MPLTRAEVEAETVALLLRRGYTHVQSATDAVGGSGGTVYTAMRRGVSVLIKRVFGAGAAREAMLMRQFRGAGVVELLYFSRQHGLLVMPRAVGDLLERIKKAVHISEAAAREIALAFIPALARVHALRVAHNDVKPENTLTTSTGGAVLSDFGLAGPCGVVRYGTRCYWASELVAAEAAGITDGQQASGIDMRCCDMYSAGAVLYVALLRNMSFDVTSSAFDGLSDDCRAFLRALLCADPAARPTAEAALRLPWLARP